MGKIPLNYRGATQDDHVPPRVRWQTIVSYTLLASGLACGLAALAWQQRRIELVSAAISLGITGAIIYFPFVRT